MCAPPRGGVRHALLPHGARSRAQLGAARPPASALHPRPEVDRALARRRVATAVAVVNVVAAAAVVVVVVVADVVGAAAAVAARATTPRAPPTALDDGSRRREPLPHVRATRAHLRCCLLLVARVRTPGTAGWRRYKRRDGDDPVVWWGGGGGARRRGAAQDDRRPVVRGAAQAPDGATEAAAQRLLRVSLRVSSGGAHPAIRRGPGVRDERARGSSIVKHAARPRSRSESGAELRRREV